MLPIPGKPEMVAVVLVDKDEKDVATIFKDVYEYTYKRLLATFAFMPGNGKTTVDTFRVPIEHARYRKEKRFAPLACAYIATEAVCKNLFGITLDASDREWFLDNDLLQPGGLPMPDTLRVVQELVAPYNLRIARCRVAPGYPIKGNLKEWRGILGMNPMGMADRGTTNAEYAEQVGMSPIEADGMFRMEYNPVPFSAGVVCEASAASEHGHASFAAPRRKATGNEILSYQLSRLIEDPWPVTAPEWPYNIRPEVDTLDIFDTTAAGGYKDPPSPFFLGKGNGSAGDARLEKMPFDDPATVQRDRKACLICLKRPPNGEHLHGKIVCNADWEAIWSNYSCQTCKLTWGKGNLPRFYGIDFWKGELMGFCPSCKMKVCLKEDDDMAVGYLIDEAESVLKPPPEATRPRKGRAKEDYEYRDIIGI